MPLPMLSLSNPGFLGGAFRRRRRALYLFEEFTFTNGTQTGRFGPTRANLIAAYNTTTNPWLEESHPEYGLFFDCASGIQEWIVPQNGTYRIEVKGAQGGQDTGGRWGGQGATIIGDFDLESGQKLKLIVGHRPDYRPTTNYRGGGGGGGSFVWDDETDDPLIIAGGGGGAGNYSTTAQANGLATQNGSAGLRNGAGAGGSNGNGGGGGTYSGGGCGWSANGNRHTNSYNSTRASEGIRPLNGGTGGLAVHTTNTQGDDGGFGGGGSSYAGAGGGGGYSGGGGGGWFYSGQGGGGGSYNDGANQSNTAGNNSGHGSVKIELL